MPVVMGSGLMCTHIYQTLAGAQLTALETKWTELISNVLQIELANVALEAEVAQLRKRERDLADI